MPRERKRSRHVLYLLSTPADVLGRVLSREREQLHPQFGAHIFPLPSPVLMLRRLVYGVTQLSGKPKGQAKQALRCRLRCTFQEREQVGIDLVRIGCGHAGWKALVDFQSAIPQLRRQRSSIGTLDSISMRLIEPLAEAQTTITMAATGRLPWFNLSRYES
jgi:hypothetical protein